MKNIKEEFINMINTIVDIDNILFEEEEISDFLLQSIQTRGIAIPVHVRSIEENQYECIDGKKRLTAAKKLSEKDAKFKRIPVMITNDFSKAGSSFWGNTQNHH